VLSVNDWAKIRRSLRADGFDPGGRSGARGGWRNREPDQGIRNSALLHCLEHVSEVAGICPDGFPELASPRPDWERPVGALAAGSPLR
jgi:hypothetical protein